MPPIPRAEQYVLHSSTKARQYLLHFFPKAGQYFLHFLLGWDNISKSPTQVLDSISEISAIGRDSMSQIASAT